MAGDSTSMALQCSQPFFPREESFGLILGAALASLLVLGRGILLGLAKHGAVTGAMVLKLTAAVTLFLLPFLFVLSVTLASVTVCIAASGIRARCLSLATCRLLRLKGVST